AGSSVKMAEQAGAVLTQMVPTINKTSELVQEISAASSEQTSGVNQITTAMGHLNSATQQNASASEELSATAEELSGQAAQLQDMMAFFQLTETESSSHAGYKPGGRTAPPARAGKPYAAFANAEQRHHRPPVHGHGHRSNRSSPLPADEIDFARL
ncbi:MAG: diguanylate cyclase, partial [Leptothrix sp. (in: b-proteobacteria)]